jgi:putative serine protease PepD
MKRLFSLVLLAGLTGAAMAVAAVVLVGRTPGNHATTTVSPAATSSAQPAAGSRREVSSSSASGSDLTATQIYQRDSGGVVAIRVRTASGEDSGTGIVLNDSGLILTNNHVVAEAESITVSPGKSANQTTAGTLVGADPNSDLALIKVDPSGLGLTPLKLANSSTVEVGDPVYAIGNPYGLDETLTRGIVSALGREIEAPDGAKIAGTIQTDAALNPGNSGGPLIDAQGEVIGVNSQIASEQADTTGSQPGSTGVGFAISSNTAAQVIKTIESGGGSVSGSTTTTEATRGTGEAARGAIEGARTEASPYGETGSSGEATSGEAGAATGSPYREGAMGGAGAREAASPSESSTEETQGAGAGGYEAGGGQVVIVP